MRLAVPLAFVVAPPVRTAVRPAPGRRHAALARLDEADERPGSEARENLRASFSLGFSRML